MHRLPTLVAVLALAAAAVPALLLGAVAAEEATPATPETEATATTTAAAQPEQQSTQRAKPKRRVKKLPRGSRYLLARIEKHRRATWHWQAVMGKPLAKSTFSPSKARSKQFRRWVLRLWKKRHAEARRQAQNPPNEWAWRCLQRYEGAWNDPNPPYWGGLQMDWSFMRAYGGHLLRRKGPASNWTPLEQMWVAERALRAGRGFYPWPNTGRKCGLI